MIVLSLPEKVLHPIFEDVALSGCIKDGKVWSDAVPIFDVEIILTRYINEKDKVDFNIKEFVEANFAFHTASSNTFVSDISLPVKEHIKRLWPYLIRERERHVSGSSLIPLPFPYVVPGGRFNEIYYWDSYFTMLGLKASGQHDLIHAMVDNFAWLIREIGFIPNGNRTYFLSRSQPPFFSLMVSLLAEIEGENTYLKYKEELVSEYKFWMNGVNNTDETADKHCVFLGQGEVLNRYYDVLQTPRSEMYGEDVHLASDIQQSIPSFFGHIRAACESGWDFSSRWCLDHYDLSSIHTNDIIPVDLNCLLFHLETTLANVMSLSNMADEKDEFLKKAERRRSLIMDYFWDEDLGYFFDFDYVHKKKSTSINASGIFPLFIKMVDDVKAEKALMFLSKNLLKDGGVVTSTLETGQQWDAPNGWAPLQWTAMQASFNYSNHYLAFEIIKKWTTLNEKVFKETGKMLEKYNVVDPEKLGGGGEYPVQDGFGWTNGVYLAMKAVESQI